MNSTLRKCTLFVAAALAVCGSSFALAGNTTDVSAEESSEKRYYEGEISTYALTLTDTVDFARMEETEFELPYDIPYYSTNLSNGCGAVAGGIIVGYYDKYCENLIADYTTCYESGYYKLQDSTYIPATIQELYTLMNTNVSGAGVSESECMDGLRAYVKNRELSIGFTVVKNASYNFNHTTFKNAINNGRPVLLFCDSVDLVDFSIGDTQVKTYSIQTTTIPHVVVGFGYYQIRYYDESDNNFRTDTYLTVASGWSCNNVGYLKVGDSSWLDSGYAVNIY